MKTLLSCLLVFFFSEMCSAQNPVLLNQETVVNFGAITKLTAQPLYFKFINDSDLKLVISESRTSFGYDVVYFPNSVEPKAIDSIGIIIDVTSLNGPFRKTVSVITNTFQGLSSFVVAGRIEE